MSSDAIGKALSMAGNPDQYMHDPHLLRAAFPLLKRARGETVRPENLGPARYQFHPAACAPDLIDRIHLRAAQIGQTGPVRLICKGAVT